MLKIRLLSIPQSDWLMKAALIKKNSIIPWWR